MDDAIDLLDDDGTEYPQSFEVVRLGESATMLLLFTTGGERARLHWVADPAARGWQLCPGVGCPLCHCSQVANPAILLPVISVARRSVEVMWMFEQKGPGTLRTGLDPHLRGSDLSDKLFHVERHGSKFDVKVTPLGPSADRCVAAVKGFMAAREQGLRLRSAFHEYSAADLAELPEVQNMLAAHPGWHPPESPNASPV